MKKCARAYLDSHWAESAKYLRDAKENLAVAVPGPERDALVRQANKATTMLADKGLSDLDNTVVVRKDAQDKHNKECAAFIKSHDEFMKSYTDWYNNRQIVAAQPTLRPINPIMDFGGSCGMGGGCGGGGMMMGGCSGGSCGGGGCGGGGCGSCR
jgi:hypothetical protein